MRKTWFGLPGAALVLMFLLAGCGGAPLSGLAVGAPELNFASGPRSTTISYVVGAPARVSLWLEDGAGARHLIRDGVERLPSGDPYQIEFDGTVALNAGERRMLPSGDYTLVAQATDASGATVEERAPLRLTAAPTAAFDIYDLKVTPNPFSPNEDAVEDVTNFTYRLPVTSTVTIEIIDPARNQRYPFVSHEERGPGEQRETWSGRPVVGGLLPAGPYTYVVTAEDAVGNRVVKEGPVEISDAGIGQAQILEARITPESLELGEVLTVTLRVKNTGTVALRTHGPPSGFEYNTNQTFATIDDERWAADKGGGLWRVGLDWEGNSGPATRYPFRWALSAKQPQDWAEPGRYDLLPPGAEVEIVGRVRIKQRENRMTFFVGLAHEGVDFPADRLRQTLVKVGF